MTLGPRLDLRQSQSLVMTPQLRQAIKLLQFSNVEVSAFIEEELERNPLLERNEIAEDGSPERPAPDQLPARAADGTVPDTAELTRTDKLPEQAAQPLDYDTWELYDSDPGDSHPTGGGGGHDFDPDARSIENIPGTGRTLRDHLGEQLRLSFSDPVDLLIGAHLIALLCPAGRLTAQPADIASALGIDLARVEAVRATMMRFDPAGLFALSLAECLGVQLAEKNRLDPAMETLLENLELLARRDVRRLSAVCGVDLDDIADMIAEIKRLDPKPAAGYDAMPLSPVVPDVLMHPANEGGWRLELNPETMPRVLVNQSFYSRVAPRAAKQDKGFIVERMQTANWLVKSLQQRAQTILRVATEIVRQQDAFFLHGVAHLRPLILRDIAEAVEMHESTVSRVTANKYIATPRGTFELKYFFTTAIAGTSGEIHSAEAVRHRIRTMISAEEPVAILSDDAVVAALRREGVDIARRTVAKYREALGIPSSVQRKREKAVPA